MVEGHARAADQRAPRLDIDRRLREVRVGADRLTDRARVGLDVEHRIVAAKGDRESAADADLSHPDAGRPADLTGQPREGLAELPVTLGLVELGPEVRVDPDET